MSIIQIGMSNIDHKNYEVSIIQWFYKEGDWIKEGENLLEIELNKVTTIIKAPHSGILIKILAKEGEIINSQKKIAEIETEKNKIKIDNQDIKQDKPTNKTSTFKYRIIASPIVKRIAKEKKINLHLVHGSGPNHRIVLKDLDRFKNYNIDSSKNIQEKIFVYSGLKKRMGDKLLFSKRNIPHYYLNISINMLRPINLIKSINDSKIGFNITINDFMVYLTSRVLSENKDLNCTVINNKITYHNEINVGVAMSINKNLFVPVIKKANLKNIFQISEEIKKVRLKIKENTIDTEYFNHGTFTISNLGMYDIEEFSAIINPPEVAILAIGKIIKKLCIENQNSEDIFKIIPMMKVTLSVDHRIVDGVKSAIFLKSLKEAIETVDKSNI